MRLAAAAAFLACYFAIDVAAIVHEVGGVSLTPWNASFALSFGFAVRGRDPLRWLSIFVAPLISVLVSGPGSGLGGAAARGGSELLACLAAVAILRSNTSSVDLTRLRTVFVFFGAATASAAIVAAIAAIEAAITADMPPWDATIFGSHRFISCIMAIGTVGPVVIMGRLRRTVTWRRLPWSAEAILQLTALVAIAWEVFGRFANEEIHFFYLLFLPFAWIATRHGQFGAIVALAAIYVAPVVSDWFFAHRQQAIIELQIRLAVLAVTTLLLGAMVSERKLSEARMIQRQAELAHYQRLNVGWEMASALAHELNQPLTAAMNYTQAALRLIRMPDPDLDRAGAIMERSIDQIERVGRTIHGLRDFMHKGELRLARNALDDMVVDAVRLVEAEANASGIVLHAAGLQGLPPVMADKTQIVQVLVNLLRNAVQAVAATERADPSVVVAADIADGNIEVSVADNGGGLQPKILDHLFEPFVTTKDSGMGLGLSISKSILEAHDGRLWGENRPGGGAVFRFTLPLAG